MTDNSNFLPKYALNQLADRVAMKVDFINKLYQADKVWDNTIEFCKKIEAEPRDVSTVIVEVTKDSRIAIGGTSIKWYNIRLTLIYILLYYRHNDHGFYKKAVFPQLIKKMGVYADDKILKSKIQQEIESIKEEDKFLEQESLKSVGNKIASIPLIPSAKDFAEGRRKFIQAINTGHVEVETINWADATISFDREVMTEIFWGVGDDKTLKSVVKAIVNTWDKLYQQKDHRCMMKEFAGTMASAIDPWKFGGLFKESIDDFFAALWVKKNAQRTYLNYGNITDSEQSNKKVENNNSENASHFEKPVQAVSSKDSNNNVEHQLSEAIQKIEEQAQIIQEQGAEIKRLNTLNEVIDKQLKRYQDEEAQTEDLDEKKKLEIDERIIFVSALLGVSLKPDVINQTQLAKLIEKLTGDTWQSIRPRISSINSETQQVIDKTIKQFSEGTQSAAKNVYELINKAVKGATRENKGYQCKQAMENINQTYQLGIKM